MNVPQIIKSFWVLPFCLIILSCQNNNRESESKKESSETTEKVLIKSYKKFIDLSANEIVAINEELKSILYQYFDGKGQPCKYTHYQYPDYYQLNGDEIVYSEGKVQIDDKPIMTYCLKNLSSVIHYNERDRVLKELSDKVGAKLISFEKNNFRVVRIHLSTSSDGNVSILPMIVEIQSYGSPQNKVQTTSDQSSDNVSDTVKLEKIKKQIDIKLGRNGSRYMSSVANSLYGNLSAENVIKFLNDKQKDNNSKSGYLIKFSDLKTNELKTIAAPYTNPDTEFKFKIGTIFQQPPMYKGNLPLCFLVTTEPIGTRASGSVSSFIFTDWLNVYSPRLVESHKIPSGARTLEIEWLDGKGRYLAEAIVLEVKGDEFKVLELHYANNLRDPYFSCMSIFDLKSGFKLDETNQIGKKKYEYFAIWSTSSDSIFHQKAIGKKSKKFPTFWVVAISLILFLLFLIVILMRRKKRKPGHKRKGKGSFQKRLEQAMKEQAEKKKIVTGNNVLDDIEIQLKNYPLPNHFIELAKKIRETVELKNQAIENKQFEKAADLRDEESKLVRQYVLAKTQWEKETNTESKK